MCFVYTNNRTWSGDASVADERLSGSLIKIKRTLSLHIPQPRHFQGGLRWADPSGVLATRDEW